MTPQKRWARRGDMESAERYSWSQCNYCGRAQDRDCQPVACMLCSTVQCFGHGMANGHCAVCSYGWLPGWFDNHGVCAYKDCGGEAVGAAHKRRMCRDHLMAARLRFGGKVQTVAEYVAAQLAHRDSGKGWEFWQEVA